MVTLPEKLDIAAGYISELEQAQSIKDWFNEKFLKKFPIKGSSAEIDLRYKEIHPDSMVVYDILENLITGVVQTDIHGTVSFFNSAASKMFGYAANEIVGKNISVFIPKLSHTHHEKFKECGREIACVRKDKSIFLSALDVSEIVVHDEHTLFAFLNYISEHEQSA